MDKLQSWLGFTPEPPVPTTSTQQVPTNPQQVPTNPPPVPTNPQQVPTTSTQQVPTNPLPNLVVKPIPPVTQDNKSQNKTNSNTQLASNVSKIGEIPTRRLTELRNMNPDYNSLYNKHQKLETECNELKTEYNKLNQKFGYNRPWYLQTAICVPKILFLLIVLGLIITLIILSEEVRNSSFENKTYDPFGTKLRFSQSRDDTGSKSTSLNERSYKTTVSNLTGNREAPNFSEYYGIDASIKNGSVMIERENFENNALSIDELLKANKGM